MNTTFHIRRYQPNDIDAVHDAVMESMAELSPWMPWCHERYSRQDAAEWVERQPVLWERNESWNFLIVDSDDQVLGSTGLHRLDLKNGVAELGYWVRSSASCRGIAPAAVRQLAEWAFREAGLYRLEILIHVGNQRSQRVAEKLGAVREAVLRERLLLHGQRHDAVLYALLESCL